MTGQQLYDLLDKHVGERYSFGVIVPKDDPTYNGPWDCAEFGTWGVYQLTQRLYGCANNQGHPHTVDAYSGFWVRDATALGTIIPLNEAATMPGAALLRVAGNGIIGHVAFSNGFGKTIEAHSTKTGVINNVIAGRRWDMAVLVPWITYEPVSQLINNYAPTGIIYRYTQPLMHAPAIADIQRKLDITADGLYGFSTFNAVRTYQAANGLNPDGEVGPLTMHALGLV